MWGDPSLYDSTLRIIDQIIARGSLAFEYKVVPGITSIQALAVDCPQGFPTTSIMSSSCSMLSARSRTSMTMPMDIYWGAYLGTADEILVSGKWHERMEDIEWLRSAARERKGWTMDTYLLRRTTPR